MAVPFNLPEDQNEVEIIIHQLQSLLTKLQAAVRRSRGVGGSVNSQVIVPRVRTMVNRSRLPSDVGGESSGTNNNPSAVIPSPNIPDLLNNLASLASATHEAASATAAAPSSSSSMVQVTSNYMTRSPRRRTSSESSSCEETKISITAILNRGVQQDWNQELDEDNDVQPKSVIFDGILSKLVTSSTSAPLWTAMICFVGWHLFKAR